jgi:hypothetical protein
VAAEGQRRLEMNGFYDRRRMRVGAMLTGEEFVARNGARVIDRIQGLRGTYARPDEKAFTWVVYQYRFGRRCAAAVWLDGIQLRGVEGIDLRALERLNAEDVDAVEVYSASEVPPRFAPREVREGGMPACGAVVIWTRQAKS